MEDSTDMFNFKEDNHEQLTDKERDMFYMYRNIFLIDREGKVVFVDILRRLGYWDTIENEGDIANYNFAVGMLKFMGVNHLNNLPLQVADWAKMPAELPGEKK